MHMTAHIVNSLALPCAVTIMLTLSNRFQDALWQSVEGNRGKLPIAVTPLPSLIPAKKHGGGGLDAHRHALGQAYTSWFCGKSASSRVDDLHMGSVPFSRWVGKSIGNILYSIWAELKHQYQLGKQYSIWHCHSVQTLLNEVNTIYVWSNFKGATGGIFQH